MPSVCVGAHGTFHHYSLEQMAPAILDVVNMIPSFIIVVCFQLFSLKLTNEHYGGSRKGFGE